MNPLPDERASELRDLFFLGAQEQLQALNELGLRLEAAPQDEDALREVCRLVHTLKGDSAVAGLRDLSELAHELEDVLTPELASAGGRALAEIVLAAADMFDAMITAFRADVAAPSGDPLRSLMWKLAQRQPAAVPPLSPPVEPRFAWTEYEQRAIRDALQRGEMVYHIAVILAPDCAMPAAAQELVRKALREIGAVLALSPESAAGTHSLEAAVSSAQPLSWILERCRVPNLVADVQVVPARQAGDAEAPPAQTPREGSRGTTLRVETAKLDQALDLAGELILSRSMLQQVLLEFTRRDPRDPLRARLSEALAFQTQVLNGLQRSLLDLRMVQVQQLFRRFPRMVRDLAKSCHKAVALIIEGGETTLDKMVLDALAEPLAHLVRNAVDHGLETPEERARAGKPAQGSLRLQARHEGGLALIEVADDGRGIDAAKVKARALECRFVTDAQARTLSDADALKFIFEAGFSTAPEITQISGRGVGLDAVKATVEHLKGSVEVQSDPGRGTRILLRVPLTLAITRAMLFQSSGRLYAVPVDLLHDVVRVTPDLVESAGGRELLRLREQLMPLVHLPDSAPSQPSRCFALVLGVAGRKYALLVDKVLGQEQLVLKPLEGPHIASELVSGASVLGDGRVVLVLNIPTVIERGLAKALPSSAPTPHQPRGSEASA